MFQKLIVIFFTSLQGFSTLESLPRSHVIRVGDCYEWEVEYHGGGLENPMVTGVSSPDRCQELCQVRQGCNFFTWVSSQHDVIDYRNTCWLKSTQGNPQPSKTCVSGPRTCSETPTTERTTTTQTSGCCERVTITSTGDTPQYQWTRLGTFHLYDMSPDGRPMYKQNDGDGNYLYYLEWLGVWYVNDNPLENMGGLINWGDAWCASDIQEQWSFYRYGSGEVNDWEVDPTLQVSCDEATTTTPSTTTIRKPNPNSEPCTWGSSCDDCSVTTEFNGVRFCCATQCDWGEVFAWMENGQVECECYH